LAAAPVAPVALDPVALDPVALDEVDLVALGEADPVTVAVVVTPAEWPNV
jgi:hypothetical protein